MCGIELLGLDTLDILLRSQLQPHVLQGNYVSARQHIHETHGAGGASSASLRLATHAVFASVSKALAALPSMPAVSVHNAAALARVLFGHFLT